jgi:hypothetical protein
MDCIKPTSLFWGHCINNKYYYFLKRYFLLISKNNHAVTKNMELITLLLGIRHLKDRYSGVYLNEVLLELFVTNRRSL